MITSNAGAEFTTKTTIIVVLPGLQGENTLVRLGEMVVLRRNKPGEFALIRGSPNSKTGSATLQK
jgi:hypothetical protein